MHIYVDFRNQHGATSTFFSSSPHLDAYKGMWMRCFLTADKQQHFNKQASIHSFEKQCQHPWKLKMNDWYMIVDTICWYCFILPDLSAKKKSSETPYPMWFCTRINHVELKITWFSKFVYQQIQWLEQLSKCWLCAGWRFNRWIWLNGSLSCQFQEYPKVLSNSINFRTQIYGMEREMILLSAWMKEREENKWTLATVPANQMARPVNIPSSLFWLCYFNEHSNIWMAPYQACHFLRTYHTHTDSQLYTCLFGVNTCKSL